MQKFLWNLTWLIIRPLLIIFCHFQIRTNYNHNDIRPPFIIAIATHANRIDPYIVGAAFDFNSIFFPIRYATAERYIYMPVLGSFLKAYGAFPVKHGEGPEKSLQEAINLLQKGKVVGIFPEGKLSRDGVLQNGKRGTAYLSQTTRLPILPVGLSGTHKLNPITFLLRRNYIKVTFGRPFIINVNENIDQATLRLMESIKNLL